MSSPDQRVTRSAVSEDFDAPLDDFQPYMK